jgi:hypothetical protein
MFNINDEVVIGLSSVVFRIIAIDNDVAWIKEKDTNATRLVYLSDLKKASKVFDKLYSFTKGLPEIIEIGLTFAFEDNNKFNRIFKTIIYKNNKPLIVVYANGRNSFTFNGKLEEISAEYLVSFVVITPRL